MCDLSLLCCVLYFTNSYNDMNYFYNHKSFVFKKSLLYLENYYSLNHHSSWWEIIANDIAAGQVLTFFLFKKQIYQKLPGFLQTLMDALRKDKIVFPNDEK